LELELSVEKGKEPKEISISLYYHEASHIFPPGKVEIWAWTGGKWNSLISEIPPQSEKVKESRQDVLTYSLGDRPMEKIKLKVSPISKLPSWHPAAGSKGWIFTDEIFLN
jgi:hypothetical protein